MSNKDRRIAFDHQTNNPKMVLAVGLSYEKPDTSYWNPENPDKPFYRWTVIPTEIDRNANGEITGRMIILLGGDGRKMTITDAPARFSRKKLEEKYKELQSDPRCQNLIKSVLSQAGLSLDKTKQPIERT